MAPLTPACLDRRLHLACASRTPRPRSFSSTFTTTSCLPSSSPSRSCPNEKTRVRPPCMRSTIPSRLTRVPSADPPLNLSAADVALLTHLCDLLCFFITHHTFRSKYLILSSPDLAKAVSRILRPRPRLTRHTHLRLAALRFLRACVARNDDFYNRFLVKHDSSGLSSTRRTRRRARTTSSGARASTFSSTCGPCVLHFRPSL